MLALVRGRSKISTQFLSLKYRYGNKYSQTKSTLGSEAIDGENLAGSLIFLRSLRGAAVSTSGALSESEDLQQSEHCLGESLFMSKVFYYSLPSTLMFFAAVNLSLTMNHSLIL